MKKNIFIMIFASVISILSISNVKADTTHFDIDTLDLSGITSLSGYTPYYVITYSNYWNTEDIVFFRSNTGYLHLADSSTPQYQNDVCLEQGACFSRVWSININQGSGDRLSSGYWTSNLGQSWTQNVTSSAYSTDPMPDVYVVKSTANLYSYSNPNQLLFSAGYEYRDSYIDLIITEESSFNNVLKKNLLLTLYDPYNDMGTGKVQYSYDNNIWYDTTLQSNGELYTLPVYTNGTMYFRIIDSDNVVIFSDTYSVTGLATISGYSVYVIPKGNHNIYISNFSNSSGVIYVEPSVVSFTNEFVYLDSFGNSVGSSMVNYVQRYDNWIPVVNSNNFENTLTGFGYNLSEYNNAKILMFNYNNNDEELVLYVENSLFIDIVDITIDSNYRCDINTDINGAMTYNDCYPIFHYLDNGTTSTIDDTSTSLNEIKETDDVFSSDNFSITFKNMFLQFSKPFYIIGNLYTNFIGVIPVPIMYSIYLGFGLLILCIFIKIWL